MFVRRTASAGRSNAFAIASSTVLSFKPIRKSLVIILMTYLASIGVKLAKQVRDHTDFLRLYSTLQPIRPNVQRPVPVLSRGVGIRWQQSLGYFTQITALEIDIVNDFVGRARDFLNRVAERRPADVQRSRVVERKWPARQEYRRDTQIVVGKAAEVVGEKAAIFFSFDVVAAMASAVRRRSHGWTSFTVKSVATDYTDFRIRSYLFWTT